MQPKLKPQTLICMHIIQQHPKREPRTHCVQYHFHRPFAILRIRAADGMCLVLYNVETTEFCFGCNNTKQKQVLLQILISILNAANGANLRSTFTALRTSPITLQLITLYAQ